MKAWIVTAEINEYDQAGAYFVAWFPTKPTWEELAKAGIYMENEAHVERGGGRLRVEDTWYNLKEVESATNMWTYSKWI